MKAPSCVTDSNGTCQIDYQAAEAAAHVFVEASLMAYPLVKSGVGIEVGVSGLSTFPSSGPGFVFGGQDDNHGSNSHAIPELVARGILVAALYKAEVDQLKPEERAKVATRLRYRDASLERGGLYDLSVDRSGAKRTPNWTPPHSNHRFGRDLDIADVGLNDKNARAPTHAPAFLKAMKDSLGVDSVAVQGTNPFPLGGGIYDEGNHYHIRVLSGGGAP